MSRIKRYPIQIFALLLVVSVLAALLPGHSSAASQTLVFQTNADAYVNSTYPGTNFGTATILRADNLPVVRSYLRFSVNGLAGKQITAASLSIRANSSSSSGLVLKAVQSTTWGETSIYFNNAPAMGVSLASAPSVTGGSWVNFNVTNYVTGEGLFSFAVTTPGETNISLASRESINYIPRLTLTVVDTLPAPTATPIPATAIPATATPIPATPIPATATRLPATATPLPATATPIPATAIPATATRIPATATPATSGDPVLVGVGDIASCGSSGDEATANLLDSIAGTVFTTGDNAYESGTNSEFANCYNPTWGRFKARTRPSPGNHDYHTSGAAGYYAYFGAAAGDPAKGYYSYNLGAWHVVVLNSEINAAAGSPQEQWLRQDLAANPTACTLAYWHKPLFSSGASHGSNPGFRALWQALYDHRAEVVVNGHEHNYERFAPQSPSGAADPKGITEFVAGMGGKSHYGFATTLPNSLVRNSTAYGVLKFTLHANSYDWQFVPVAGQTFSDAGSAQCTP